MSDAEQQGRKIFFLYPEKGPQDELVRAIVKHEYEAFLIRDPQKAHEILRKFNNSILFIDIDAALPPNQWTEKISSIKNDSETASVLIGLHAFRDKDPDMDEPFYNVKPQLGLIHMQKDLQKNVVLLEKLFAKLNVKGRRKFVRTHCNDDGTFNLKVEDKTHTGKIKDISTAGMTCEFDSDVYFKRGSNLRSIQLHLGRSLCMVSGPVIGHHGDDKKLHVIIFDQTFNSNFKQHIHDFIYRNLQQQLVQTEAEPPENT